MSEAAVSVVRVSSSTGTESESVLDATGATDATGTGALSAALDGPLVSTQWLADHLGSDGLVVLDATVASAADASGARAWVSGLDAYLADGHLPGAVFADLVDAFSDPLGPLPFTRPDAASFAEAAGELGVDSGTTVVVYDTSVGQWASRLWWLFRSFGHEQVAVLDGGATKWRAEGRELELGFVDPRPAGGFTAVELPGFWSDKQDVADILDGVRPGALVCGTPAAAFAEAHIPGSLSAPAARLVSRETNAFLPPAQLRPLFADLLASESPIVTYCGAGIAAAADALALQLLGRDDVTVYDGSLGEWTADPAAPVASLR